MHTTDLSSWQHAHHFHSANVLGEKNTRRVVVLTAVMMVVEITTGWIFHSMALLADGWHMSSHVLALGLTAGAYALSRRYANDTRFAFGTWKIEVLGGFTSAILLGGVALFMALESIERLFHPVHPRSYSIKPLWSAVIGLAVNVISALMLRDHDHHHGHSHGHAHADLNLRAAYVHVIADATTSVPAIGALVGGKFLHWNWLDSAMGIVGAIVVGVWAWGLLRDTSRVLLDREMDSGVVEEIREVLESDGETRVSDLHVWRVGRNRLGRGKHCDARAEGARFYKSLLSVHEEIAHVTLEVNRCPG